MELANFFVTLPPETELDINDYVWNSRLYWKERSISYFD